MKKSNLITAPNLANLLYSGCWVDSHLTQERKKRRKRNGLS